MINNETDCSLNTEVEKSRITLILIFCGFFILFNIFIKYNSNSCNKSQHTKIEKAKNFLERYKQEDEDFFLQDCTSSK